MAVRNSGYERIANDTYITPMWVFEALHAVEPWSKFSCDPCPANADSDMLEEGMLLDAPHIVSNPPFKIAERIIRHSVNLTEGHQGKCAFLLPHTFDTAKCRVDLFDRPPFARKYALTTRMRWTNLAQKRAGPSTNHSWYVFDHAHCGPATMAWL
jgi:hypothetical protein